MRDEALVVRPAHRLAGALRGAFIIACLFSWCTCAGNPPPVPTPTATVRPPDTATPAPRDTDTPPPVTATAQPPPPPPSPTADSKRLAACQGYVAVLSGRTKDSAALNNADLRRLADADLVTCGAVFGDSATMCEKLMPEEHGPSMDCLHAESTFHELRAYPGTRSFLFDDVDWKECHAVPELATFCTSLRQALRSGNSTACAHMGDAQSVCSAYMDMDKSRCQVTGKLATLEVKRPGEPKAGEPERARVKDWIEGTCRQNIESRAFLAPGLEAIAQSGPPRERELAKAALAQNDACQTYTQAAIQSCMGTGAPGATPVSAPATPVGAPPPGTPAPQPG